MTNTARVIRLRAALRSAVARKYAQVTKQKQQENPKR